MKFWLPRVLLLAGFVLLLTYFVYREIAHPWVLNGFATEPAAPSAGRGEEDGAVGEAGDPTAQRPEPGFRLTRETPTPRPSAAAADVERRLFEAQATLARAMEQKMANRIEAVHSQFDERGEKMERSRQVIGQLVSQVRHQNEASADALAETISAIENDLTAFAAASADLSNARGAWRETYDTLMEVGRISGEVMDERNYDFEEYTVGSNETLRQIAHSLERHYQVTRADLETLITMFNEVVTRPRATAGRRGTIHVVTNPTLRIPLPKNTRNMLNDSGVDESLQAQRVAMEQAEARQSELESRLGSRIDEMRQIVQRVRGLEQLAADIEQSIQSLEPENLSFLDAPASPEQQDAWRAFNRAFDAYARTDSQELQGEAANRLETATRQLIAVYEPTAGDAGAPGSEDSVSGDDLEWFLQFIEPYDPTDPESAASLPALIEP